MTSGVRQTLEARCGQCGAIGTVQLGMLVTNDVADVKVFHCPQCGESLQVDSGRHILGMAWAKGSEMSVQSSA